MYYIALCKCTRAGRKCTNSPESLTDEENAKLSGARDGTRVPYGPLRPEGIKKPSSDPEIDTPRIWKEKSLESGKLGLRSPTGSDRTH